MLALVFIILSIIVAAAGAAMIKFGTSDDAKGVGIGVLGLGLVVGLVIYVIASISSVPARTVGIVTEFGKAVGTVDSGFHWLSPWSEVTEFPTSNQTLDLDASDGGDKVVQVKFAGGGSGYVNVNIVWQVEDNNNSAVNLYNNWKDFDLVGVRVVEPQAYTVVGQVVGQYVPEEAVKSENNKKISDKIKDELNGVLKGTGIRIESVAVKKIDPDATIQDRINKKFVADQNIEIASKDQEKAVIEEATNKAKEKSLTDGALRAECLEITRSWDQHRNGPLPANWNCSTSPLPLTVPVR